MIVGCSIAFTVYYEHIQERNRVVLLLTLYMLHGRLGYSYFLFIE